jgi:hypothetical protein
MDIRPVGDELFVADGQMDMTKLVIALRNFMKTPKNLRNLNEVKDQAMLLVHLILCMVWEHFFQEVPDCKKKM